MALGASGGGGTGSGSASYGSVGAIRPGGSQPAGLGNIPEPKVMGPAVPDKDLGDVIEGLGGLAELGKVNIPKVSSPQIPETPFPYFDLPKIREGLYGGIDLATKGATADAKSLFAQMGLSDSTMMGHRLNQIALSGEATKAGVEQQLYGMALEKAQLDQARNIQQAQYDFQTGVVNAQNVYNAAALDINSALNAYGLMSDVIMQDIQLQFQINQQMAASLQQFIAEAASL